MSEGNHASTLQLRVYTRLVYSGDGELSGEMRVYCPDKAQSMTLEHCMTCTRWAGLHFQSRDRGSFLECNATLEARVPLASPGTRVSDIMTPTVVCVRPDLGIEAVLEKLGGEHASAAVVIDEQGKPIGMLSRTDVLTARSQMRGDENQRVPANVDDVMTPLVFAVREHVSASQAAGLMAVEGVRHVIVVASSGEVVGLLSAIDVLRWVAERDGFLKTPDAAAK